MLFILALIILMSWGLDYINGFHDTANAIATVISTGVMSARNAILMAACLNFGGALLGTHVAMTIAQGIADSSLVVPEVITGLSLLLFFVVCQDLTGGWPSKGVFTIWAGHTSVGMAYAAVVIQSRLLEMDKSLEEAAMDLGCKPFQVFYLVTLPMIAQSLMSSWLLTFTLSLDDVVATAFLNGPGSTTVPLVSLSRAKLGLNPTVNAIATITVAVVAIGVLAGSLWLSRQETRRAAEQAAAYREGMGLATAV